MKELTTLTPIDLNSVTGGFSLGSLFGGGSSGGGGGGDEGKGKQSGGGDSGGGGGGMLGGLVKGFGMGKAFGF